MVEEHPFSLDCIQTDLEVVFAKLRTWLNADAAVLLDRYLPEFGVDVVTPPAFVLLSARLAGSAGCAVLPALFMSFIYLAVTLHRLPQQIRGRDRQLVILEGDYLYAHLSLLLCQTDCLRLQERFSRLIRGMNEGSVLRQFYQPADRPETGRGLAEILGQQYGLFFAECCDLGGYFAGLQQDEAPLLRRFGHQFGIAYGFKEAGLGHGVYMPFLEQALDCLNSLSATGGKDELGEFARELVTSSAGKRFLAAG
jgi:hypothetical protein